MDACYLPVCSFSSRESIFARAFDRFLFRLEPQDKVPFLSGAAGTHPEAVQQPLHRQSHVLHIAFRWPREPALACCGWLA